MSAPTFAVVPVKNEWELTAGLLACLHRQVDDLLVIDNGSTDGTQTRVRLLRQRCPNLHLSLQYDASIYEMWNNGFERARRRARGGPFSVLITNNDILLQPWAVASLNACLTMDERAAAAYPDYDVESLDAPLWQGQTRRTRGVLGDGGLFGACFMLAGDRIPWRPLITDLSYEWWYGDNHLAETIQQHGLEQVRAVGLPVKHLNEGTAGKLDASELYGRKLRDKGRWLTRYDRA